MATFNFSFDADMRTGEVANAGEPVFTVTAKDGQLHYAGGVRGQKMEQTRDVLQFWPLDEQCNMMVVTGFTVPGPGGTLLELGETHRIYDGTYIRRQEYREAGSGSDFTLKRDARFTKTN